MIVPAFADLPRNLHANTITFRLLDHKLPLR
jgi:hypothetical protein